MIIELYILKGIGPDFKEIITATKAIELHGKLIDGTSLKHEEGTDVSLIPKVNLTWSPAVICQPRAVIHPTMMVKILH